MRCSAILWFVVAVAGSNVALSGGDLASEVAHALDYPKLTTINIHAQSNLRSLHTKAVLGIISVTDRKLQDDTTVDPVFSDQFSIPFRLIWKMSFSEETILEEPTEDEYNGLFYGTLAWLLASANQVYANETLFQVQSFDMTYFGTMFNASDQYASTIAMECQCILYANNETDIPPLLDFLFTISTEYNRTVFLEDYLTIQPDVGIFKEVEDLRYNIIPSPLPVIVPFSTQADMEIEILSMTLEFRFDAPSVLPDQDPKSHEYDVYLEATSQWFTGFLTVEYPGQNDTQPAFLNLSSSIVSTSHEPTANLTTYAILVQTDISFQVPTSGTVKLPTAHDILRLMSAQDVENYMLFIQTAQPELGLLTEIRVVSWQYLGMGYGPWVKS
jgi:hypothetical protein